MNETTAEDVDLHRPAVSPPPRVWPLVVSLLIQSVLFALSITSSINNAVRFGFMLEGPALGVFVLLVWLLFACRLRAAHRFIILAFTLTCAAVVAVISHPSIRLGMFLYGVPGVTLAIWAAVMIRQGQNEETRLKTILGFVTVVWAVFPLLRIDGIDGQYLPDLSFRWSATPEQQMLESRSQLSSTAPAAWSPEAAEWPGFRGPDRNGRVDLDLAELNWSEHPPVEVWRQPIGPGWGSFVHVSNRLFTQEQRGDDEAVTCYEAATGGLIWRHTDPVRFSDVVAGAGPRATPEYHSGLLFTYGSRAVLNCLNAETGDLVWQRDLMKEVNAQLPVWGFSNSPLAIGDLVVIYAGGDEDNGLMALRADTGESVWQVPSRGMNFSSPQLVTIDGVEQLIFGDEEGLRSLQPATGSQLWSYKPTKWEGPAVCQPQLLYDTDLIVALGDGIGVARLNLSQEGSTWRISELWTTNRMKPSFNDFVVYGGCLYGFDQSIFVCLDAETGQRHWKQGRYGFGQVVLLSGQGQLIVVTEDGELVLINATPDDPEEVARVPAVNGKTWNHPMVAGGRLFVRNGAEAVSFQLSE